MPRGIKVEISQVTLKQDHFQIMPPLSTIAVVLRLKKKKKRQKL